MPQPNIPTSLRPILSGTAATAGLAMIFSSLPTTANAQSAVSGGNETPGASAPDAIALDPVSVSADRISAQDSGNVNAVRTGISRLPETVKETPRVINVVPEEIIKQQRATSLEQVLRNVPGITISTGEGQGGQNGDQFRIRGLTARGDIYTDGLKDFGVYTHDVFNTESVQVLKGPSGDGFGVGNSGGLINQSTKQAKLESVNRIEQSFGSGPTYRTTADVNHKLDDTVALRVNALYYNQEVADRDEAEAERWGLAADLGMGIGTRTTWHLNYSYLKGEKTPDMGVPMMTGRDGIITPATEYGLDRSTSYIRDLDRDDTENHVLTSTLSHEVSDHLTLYNDTRWSLYDRDWAATNPAALSAANSAAFLNGGNPNLTYGAGGGMAYKQDGWGVQNIAGVKAEGTLLGLKHKANGGLDLNYQEDTRQMGTWVGRTANQTVVNPIHSYASGAYLTYPDSGIRSASVQNTGVFVSDRVWLHDQVSVQGGVRWDYFRTSFRSQTSSVANGQDIERTWSPSASLIYEPTKDSSLYTTYSRSNKPVGTDIASAVTVGSNETPNGNRDFDPEETDLYEVGGKADFLNGRLGVNGAAFLIEKQNTYTYDAETGALADGFIEAGLGLRIKGFESGISGKITPAWSVYGSYAFLTGEITDSKGSPANVGNDAPNVPKHNASLWTTYALSEDIGDVLPGKLMVGGGVQYASEYWADAGNTARAPDTFSLDALLSYEYESVSLALNGYNLTDHRNYASVFNNSRAVPTSGRTFMLTAGLQF